MILRPWNDDGTSSSASASNDVSGWRRRTPLGAGHMIVMPANQTHALKAISRFRMMLTMIWS